MNRISVYALALVSLIGSGSVLAQTQKRINSAADLPRFNYPLSQPASQLLVADDATFNAFAAKVKNDVNSVLSGYTIEDAATKRDLLATRLDVEMLDADRAGALATIEQIRNLEEKPAAKLTDALVLRAVLAAWQQAGTNSGPAFEKEFKEQFAKEIAPLPWAVTGESLKEDREDLEIRSMNLLLGRAQRSLDPQVAKTGGLDLPGAQTLLAMRVIAKFEIPIAQAALDTLSPFIAAHEVQKPDIWQTRDVTLTDADHLTPVRIAIFDSGVDTSLYPGLLFDDPHPDGHSSHGLAFDTEGNLVDRVLQPLTPEQKDLYPKVIGLLQGLDDLESGIDSPAAAAARKTLSAMPPDQLAPFLKQLSFLGQYLHGTHVAGIASSGNPAARLVVVSFYDSLPDISFPPTLAWAEKFKADFKQVGDYFREHNVRVVNMSWGDNHAEFEQWLDKTSTEKDANKRKEFAGQLYAVWHQAVEDAIKAAPNTLWVSAAGNSDSNASFLGDVPASLQLPNLISVGAVDQAGDETSFTSYGKTVRLYADGYRVISYVPGGTRLRLSGTSMASPNVANLAAKLIALDPKLTPEQTIALMEEGSTASADGRFHLIDPKASVELLRKKMAGK